MLTNEPYCIVLPDYVTCQRLSIINCWGNMGKPMDTQNQEVALPTTSLLKLYSSEICSHPW